MHRRWSGGLAATLASIAMACLSTTVAAVEPLEHQVKAAFLFNFARFTTWPPAKFSGDADALRFCVLEQDPFARVLEATLQDKRIERRALTVHRARRAEDLRDCHVAYLDALDADRLLAALITLAGSGVLTVYEGTETLPGGAIRFYLVDRTVHFEINTAATEREQLQLSSHLLSVASVVRR